MSTRGGRGGAPRGRPRKPIPDDEPEQPQDFDASPSALQQEVESKKHVRAPKPKAQDPAVLFRNMDIARSKIGVLIDSLEGDDTEAVLKRNVATAVKHLKVIYDLLEH